MRISPYTKKIEVDDAVFLVNISYAAKRAFADCLKMGKPDSKLKPGMDPENAEMEFTEIELRALVDVLVEHRCIAGWEGIEVEREDGTVAPLEFNQNNVKLLDYSTLIEVASRAMGYAFSTRGNESGSESK